MTRSLKEKQMTYDKDAEVLSMRAIAAEIAKLLQEKEADIPTASAALALLLCVISRDNGLPVEGLINTFTESARIAYLIQPETMQ